MKLSFLEEQLRSQINHYKVPQTASKNKNRQQKLLQQQ